MDEAGDRGDEGDRVAVQHDQASVRVDRREGVQRQGMARALERPPTSGTVALQDLEDVTVVLGSRPSGPSRATTRRTTARWPAPPTRCSGTPGRARRCTRSARPRPRGGWPGCPG